MTNLKLILSNGEEKLYTCLALETEEKRNMLVGYTFADGTKIVKVELA